MKGLYLLLLFQLTSLSCLAQQILMKDSIKSEILEQTRHINLVIPDTSGMLPDSKLNVIYVLDGDPTLANLVASHFSFITDMKSDKGIPGYLVVGIESENSRWDDFLTKGEFRETGRADKFLRFLSDELFPFIESRYNLNNHRVCIGHSLGGTLGMHALCDRDSLFNAYILFSPNLIYDKFKLIHDFKAKNTDNLNKFVSIANGDTGELEQGYAKGVKMLDSLVTHTAEKENLRMRFEYLSDVNHSESLPVSLGRAVKEYLDYSYGTPGEEIRMNLLKEEDYAQAVQKYYDKKQPYLGYQFYPEVYSLYNDWITIAGLNEQLDKVLQLADWAIEVHKDDFYHYIMYLAKAIVYQEKKEMNAALKSCDDAKKVVESLREKVDPQSYQYALEEINETVDDVKQTDKAS